MRKDKLAKAIYDYINCHYNEEHIELCEYIKENSLDIEKSLQLDSDSYEVLLDDYTNNAGDLYFQWFVPYFRSCCKGKGNRLILVEEEGSYFLNLNDYARNIDNKKTNHYYDILQRLCAAEIPDQNKGDLYEFFCQKWFAEFCDVIKKTPSSNDKGIDLIGKVTIDSRVNAIVNNLECKVIVQTKLFSGKVDTPVIRALLGDVLFLTYDDSEVNIFSPTLLCVCGHAGFTQGAISFAKKYGVILLDSKDMIRIISEMGDLQQFECIKYLDTVECKL